MDRQVRQKSGIIQSNHRQPHPKILTDNHRYETITDQNLQSQIMLVNWTTLTWSFRFEEGTRTCPSYCPITSK